MRRKRHFAKLSCKVKYDNIGGTQRECFKAIKGEMTFASPDRWIQLRLSMKNCACVLINRADFGEVKVSGKGHPVIKTSSMLVLAICSNPEWLTPLRDLLCIAESRDDTPQSPLPWMPECGLAAREEWEAVEGNGDEKLPFRSQKSAHGWDLPHCCTRRGSGTAERWIPRPSSVLKLRCVSQFLTALLLYGSCHWVITVGTIIV